MGIEPRLESPENPALLGQGGAESGAPLPGNPDIAPDLLAIVDAWPRLPESIRAGILALVRAAVP
jgi:hypothetical protein